MDWETLYEAQAVDYRTPATIVVLDGETGQLVEVIADGDEEGPALD